MIDSHAHLLPEFVKNIEEDIANAQKANVKAIINSAIEPSHYNFAKTLAKRYNGYIYNTFGFAPQKIKSLDFEHSFRVIKETTSIVAIGEVGLDYHWIQESSWRAKEREIFSKFIHLANEVRKPIVIHSRKAEGDCIEILEKEAEIPVLMHCFAGTMLETKRIIDNGWLISIPTAVINRKKHRKIARIAPLERLVVETDTPFLSPIKGEKNEPANIRYAIQEIANLKEQSFEIIDQVTTRNAEEFYNI